MVIQGADTFSGGVGDDTLYLGDDSAVDTVVFASSAANNTVATLFIILKPV